ncbi:MAG: hypothetical protein AAGH99_07080 [Planctomycetota bacterium]
MISVRAIARSLGHLYHACRSPYRGRSIRAKRYFWEDGSPTAKALAARTDLNCDMRTAAFAAALKHLAEAYRLRGIFP